MSETREVFEMVTKQTEPDLGSWHDQERHQRKRAQRRKAGAFVLVAALVVAGGAAFALQDEDTTSGVADQPTPTPVSTSTSAPPPALTSAFLGFIDLTTGETSTIPVLPAGSGMDVSPDGTRIAYVDDLDGEEVVHIADIDGSNVQALEETGAAGGVAGPRWSPDGSSIVYQGQAQDGWVGNIYVVDVDSGQIRKITELDDYAADLYYMAPTFDPTGSTVLFNLEVEGSDPQRVDLWSVPVTGGEATLVRRDAFFGDYSPDGRQIAFTPLPESESGFGDLWVAPSAGGKAQKLASGSIVIPRWSPDGTRIAYNDGSGGVYVVNVETGEQGLVLESERLPEWVDDDTLSLSP